MENQSSPRFVSTLPFSEACERNKGPLLEVLQQWLAGSPRFVLEVGSGTGQHAVYFSRQMPHLTWQPTEQTENLTLLEARVSREGPPNLLPPLELDVEQSDWPLGADSADAVFTANTFHIMSWPQVQAFFRGMGPLLRDDGLLIIYGPFRYGGQYTSHTNVAFDKSLKALDPKSGIRDFEAVDALAVKQGLVLMEDHAMPATNQTLVWRKA
jgi:cyclopropane fatty-acyl-phospholipid synthase-like methyltransferase